MPENIAFSIADCPNCTNNTQMEIQTQGSNAGVPVGNKTQNDGSERTNWRELGYHCYIRMLIIAGLFYYLFHNEVESIVSRWVEPNWSHGLLIPFFSLYFINQYKKEILNLQTRPNYLGLFFSDIRNCVLCS